MDFSAIIKKPKRFAQYYSRGLLILFSILGLILSACQPSGLAAPAAQDVSVGIIPTSTSLVEETPTVASTPLPQRPTYSPGELVDYQAQSGDTLIALAARFNTTVTENS